MEVCDLFFVVVFPVGSVLLRAGNYMDWATGKMTFLSRVLRNTTVNGTAPDASPERGIMLVLVFIILCNGT
jgi:hypothetical protein